MTTTVYVSDSQNFVKKANMLFILFMEIKQGTDNHQTKYQLQNNMIIYLIFSYYSPMACVL